MIFHRKKDERKHLHILWQTVKDEKIIDIWRYKKRLQRQADQMEWNLGISVPGAKRMILPIQTGCAKQELGRILC
ncbi:MAG: hypothetical protein KDE26_21485 [Bacteroidetes bacterium]|nr:hypothetical protein [Bacteroidota bacterium]